MVKGTPSFGKHQKKTHTRCRRCGRHSYNIKKGYCAACGYGRSSRLRKYAWQNKDLKGRRKKQAIVIITYILPKELRKELRKPFGEFFLHVVDAKPLLKGKKIISVGDVISYHLLKNEIEPEIIVFDEKERRMEVDPKIRNVIHSWEAQLFIAKNPPGHITNEVWDVVEKVLKQRRKAKIFIDGEEDLVALAFMNKAPKGYVVLYGLHDGFVVAEINEDLKKKTDRILQKMKRNVSLTVKTFK